MKRSRSQIKAMFARMAEKITGAPHKVAEHAHTIGKQLRAATEYQKQQALDLARHAHVEGAVAKIIDLPFTWAEGIAGRHIDKRVSRLEKLVASRTQGLQEHVTERVA